MEKKSCRNVVAQASIARAVDLAHTTGTKTFVQLIDAEPLSRERGDVWLITHFNAPVA
jgi:hypothetical protein